MITDPRYRQLALETLCKSLLNDPNPRVRQQVAEGLGQIGDDTAIPTLCLAFEQDPVLKVRQAALSAMVQLLKPEPPFMSDTPKFDLRGATITGNLADTVQGDQVANQTIQQSASTQSDFDLSELQTLLTDLSETLHGWQQKHPNTANDTEVSDIIDVEVQEIKQSNPMKWQNFLKLKRLWNGSKMAAVRIGDHFSEQSVWGKGLIGFLEGVTEDTD